MAIRRRDLDNARDFGRHITQTTLLQDIGADASYDDVLPIVDVSERYDITQAKQTTISGLWQPIATEIRRNPTVLPRLFGAFSSTVTQTNASTSGINVMTVNTVDVPDGFTVVSGSQITAQASGVYNLQFSTQLEKTTANADTVEIFLRKNGSDVPNSNTEVTVQGSSARSVAAWNFYVPLASGDYAQLAWYSADIHVRLAAVSGQTNPTRPAIPSVIITIGNV